MLLFTLKKNQICYHGHRFTRTLNHFSNYFDLVKPLHTLTTFFEEHIVTSVLLQCYKIYFLREKKNTANIFLLNKLQFLKFLMVF